jgi:hypothetical protein
MPQETLAAVAAVPGARPIARLGDVGLPEIPPCSGHLMRQFQTIFGVPPRHSLVLLRHVPASDAHPREEWRHEQRDEAGRLVARYESVEEAGARRSRFRKLDPDGRLVAEGELPF